MIRFQADADLQHRILRAVRLQEPAIDFRSAAEGGLIGKTDPEVLEIASQHGRILVTHDRRTMPGHFRDRLNRGNSSPGVFIVSQFEPIASVVEILMMTWAASRQRSGRIKFVICLHCPSISSRDEDCPA